MSVGRRAVAAALATALTMVLTGAACSSSDPADDGDTAGDVAGDPAADAASEAASTTAPAPAPETTAATTTTIVGPVVGDELGAIEVSARLIDVGEGEERLLAIGADDALAEVPLPHGASDQDELAGWCGPGATGDPELLVRVAPPAVDHAEGGLERFELLRPDLDTADAGAGTVRFDVDGESYESPDAEIDVADDAATGTFRAELADGSVIEGAYRCE